MTRIAGYNALDSMTKIYNPIVHKLYNEIRGFYTQKHPTPSAKYAYKYNQYTC